MMNTGIADVDFLEDVLNGLCSQVKELPCKYLYDRRGSGLFDRICEVPEYYPTRAEIQILQLFLDEISACVGRNAALVEYGAGSGIKTRILLNSLVAPAGFVPVDISREYLLETAVQLRREFPALAINPVCADFTRPLALPLPGSPDARRVVFFPGSTIGNFEPAEARRFLSDTARFCRRGGGLIIGVDLKKDVARLEAAYNDNDGVTARFNLNLLYRINRELGANFEPEHFLHQAIYNEAEGCIEMHLVSLRRQNVTVHGCGIHFDAGEAILTERSYKYHPDEFADLAASAGFSREHFWTDPEGLFSVQYFVAA